MCSRSLVVIFAFILGLQRFPAAASPPGYQVEAWTVESGLPQNTVLSLAQTPDGYLWLATFNGLGRFDGVRIVVFHPMNTPELRSSRIIDLSVDAQGRLWIFSEEGLLTRMVNGRFEAMNGKLGVPSGPVGSRKLDPDGNIWIGVVGPSLFRFDGEMFRPAQRREPFLHDDLPKCGATSRGVWFKGGGGWEKVALSSFYKAVADRGIKGVAQAAPTRSGDVAVLYDEGIRFLKSGQTIRIDRPPFMEPTELVEGPHGAFLVSTWKEGLFVVDGDGKFEHVPLSGGMSALSIRTVAIDAESNCWIGTDVAGLQKIKSKVFHTLTRADGLSGEVIKSVVCDSRGRIFALTQNGADRLDLDGSVKNLSRDPELWLGATDDKDQVWLANFSGGLARVGESAASATPFGNGRLRTISPAHGGGLWLGFERGLDLVREENHSTLQLPAGKSEVRAVVDAGAEGLWVGLHGGGLWRKKSGEWKHFGVTEGLSDQQVSALLRDGHGALWIGTVFGGLHRLMGGKLSNFQNANILMPSHISSITADDRGSLWLGSLNGIYRVSVEELNEVADGARTSLFVRRFGKGEGLGTSECADARQPVTCKTPDGRVWFATINGLSVVDPADVPMETRTPRLVVEEVIADGKAVPTVNGAVRLPAGTSHLQIRYTVLGMNSPEDARFQYRLTPVDDRWVNAGQQRVATFNHVGPGRFTFQVTSTTEAAIRAESIHSLRVNVAPLWWQRRPVQGVALTGGIAALGGLVFFRLKTLERRRALQQELSRRLIESQEKERQRIAGELHDGLGQELLVIKNYALMASSGGVDNYNSISATATRALQQVREISYNLRPYQLDELGLTAAIRGMFDRLNTGLLHFHVEIDEIDGIYSKEDEIHLFRTLQELTNNILKHSGATEARVLIKRDGVLKIVVIDNGCGMNPGHRAAGLGLRGIAERVDILNGSIQFSAAENGGAKVQILLPIHPKPSRVTE